MEVGAPTEGHGSKCKHDMLASLLIPTISPRNGLGGVPHKVPHRLTTPNNYSRRAVGASGWQVGLPSLKIIETNKQYVQLLHP